MITNPLPTCWFNTVPPCQKKPTKINLNLMSCHISCLNDSRWWDCQKVEQYLQNGMNKLINTMALELLYIAWRIFVDILPSADLNNLSPPPPPPQPTVRLYSILGSQMSKYNHQLTVYVSESMLIQSVLDVNTVKFDLKFCRILADSHEPCTLHIKAFNSWSVVEPFCNFTFYVCWRKMTFTPLRTVETSYSHLKDIFNHQLPTLRYCAYKLEIVLKKVYTLTQVDKLTSSANTQSIGK